MINFIVMKALFPCMCSTNQTTLSCPFSTIMAENDSQSTFLQPTSKPLSLIPNLPEDAPLSRALLEAIN